MEFDFSKYYQKLDDLSEFIEIGRIKEVVGNMIKAHNIGLEIGGLCEIFQENTDKKVLAEVVGFQNQDVFIMPLEDTRGLSPKSKLRKINRTAKIAVGDALLGRVFDGLMRPIDGKPDIVKSKWRTIYNEAPNPMDRKIITEALDVGIKSINGLLTIGKGQRVAILSGSGVGKSVLLGMMARNTKADVNVVGLIGERGREVREFIEKDLGEEGLKKTVVIAATSDKAPLVRVRSAYCAATVAEYFREQGLDVLLLIDSLSRFAMAQREIGLSIGEPPTTKGYPPSVFTKFPQLLERAGNSDSKGSITGLYTVLIEGDDPNDPIGDTVRSIVDGHIILDRNIAAGGFFPAIDILNSKSRLMRNIVPKAHWQKANYCNQVLMTHKNAEDLINIGAYVKGSNESIDYAINKIGPIRKFLRQDIAEKTTLAKSQQELAAILEDFKI